MMSDGIPLLRNPDATRHLQKLKAVQNEMETCRAASRDALDLAKIRRTLVLNGAWTDLSTEPVRWKRCDNGITFENAGIPQERRRPSGPPTMPMHSAASELD